MDWMEGVCLLLHASALLDSDSRRPFLPILVVKHSQVCAFYSASPFFLLLLSSSAAINGIAGAAGKQALAIIA